MFNNTDKTSSKTLNRGLNTSKNFFNLQEGQSPACINIEFNNDNSFSKRLGTSTMNTVALESTGGYGMYDFGMLGYGGIDVNTKVLLHFDGADGSTTFTDSIAAKVFTANGNAQIDTAQLKFGTGSGLFDGTGDYITTPDHADFYYGTGDFTIDFWVRFNALGTTMVIYSQYVDDNNRAEIDVSTTGRVGITFVIGGVTKGDYQGPASLFSTNTWYHLEWARNGSTMYFFVDGVSKTLTTYTAISTNDVGDVADVLSIGARDDGSRPFNGWLDELRISKGIARHTAGFTPPSDAYSSDVIQQRRLLCSSGTGIYASQDIGRNWAIVQTNRAAAINYFSFTKDYVINTNESYNLPQYWTGSNSTYFANISTATPACKHSLSHQGYLILLNESNNKTGFYYVDQNSMFDSAFSSFKLPTDRNDELTGGFSLGRILYVSSKYKIFRLLFTGGNPDWIYTEIKDFGFIPKTIKKINISGVGEVVIGMDWSKRIRVFDGTNDEVISDIITEDNGITPFYLSNVSDINLNKCWAEDDKKAQVYRLHLVYGGSSTVSYSINFNYRSGALYPENNRPFQSGVLAKDTADASYMLACDYNGRIHQLDSGNTDNGVAIDEYFVSSLLYNQNPTRVLRNQQLDLFFSSTSSGTLYLEDRNQYSNLWNLSSTFTLGNTVSSIQIRQTINLPTDTNVYQFKLSTSANTATPWRSNLVIFSPLALGVGEP